MNNVIKLTLFHKSFENGEKIYSVGENVKRINIDCSSVPWVSIAETNCTRIYCGIPFYAIDSDKNDPPPID